MTESNPPHDDATSAPGAVFSVVSGNPTDEELAALTVVLLAAASGDDPPAPKRVTGSWSDPAHLARVPVRHGVGGWRAGALP